MGGWNKYIYPLDPIGKVDPYGLQPFNGIDMGRATTERASLGLWMTQNGGAPDVIAKAMAPLYSSSPLSRECRISGILAAGAGLSGGGAYNERNGASAQIGMPVAAVGARASMTCGLKLRSTDAKDLKVASGLSIGLGVVSIEVMQTTKWPEIYIGVGPGIGPEIKIPYNPNVSGPIY